MERRILAVLIWLYWGSGGAAGEADGDKSLVVIGSEFYRRSEFDSGEIWVYLRNDSDRPISIGRCEVKRRFPAAAKRQEVILREIKYLCSKLTPPVLMPGGNGDLLIKLFEAPAKGTLLECGIRDDVGNYAKVVIAAENVPVWVTYLGFCEGIEKGCIYVQNNSETAYVVRLLEAEAGGVNGEYEGVNVRLGGGEKAALLFKLPEKTVFGEYVHVVLSAESVEGKRVIHRVVRAVDKFPIVFEGGAGDEGLGMDAGRFFAKSRESGGEIACIQVMERPAHGHGLPEEAAAKFLKARSAIFSEEPRLLTKMDICRFDRPRAWFKFGVLADVAAMNPVLTELEPYKAESEIGDKTIPFFWLATEAKKATEPERFFAIIPLEPENGVFAKDKFTPAEIKFLVYCGIFRGAKGILYRGEPPCDGAGRDAFIQLNKELRELKPLLGVGEPVDWASNEDSNYAAKSLLCANEAIITAIFDRRYFSSQDGNELVTPVFGKVPRSVKVKTKVPKGFFVSEVESVYGPVKGDCWICREGQLEMTVQMADSVQVYKIMLVRNGGQETTEDRRR